MTDWLNKLTDDPLGRACLIERDNIRREVADTIARVRRWEPAPLPQREEK